jgi:hypothetical protein
MLKVVGKHAEAATEASASAIVGRRPAGHARRFPSSTQALGSTI